MKPNILFIIVDQLRYPVKYESDDIKKYTSKFIWNKMNGCHFKNHYCSTTSCSPSRATILTGHMPSYHGVISSKNFNFKTMPTMGHYFRQAGYSTHWIGKWNISNIDFNIPGSNSKLSSYDDEGQPDNNKINIYQKLNCLNEYGFDDWIGPEPIGDNPLDSGDSAKKGLGRDPFYSTQAIMLLEELNSSKQPWCTVLSYVNPNDISLYFSNKDKDDFDFEIDNNIPENVFSENFIKTQNDNLSKKPKIQEKYSNLFKSNLVSDDYYRIYYNLQEKVNNEIEKVLDNFRKMKSFSNTIIILTSDHGTLCGAHSNMHENYYNIYEESIHIPLIISHPKIKTKCYEELTSHIDILPTLLGLCSIKINYEEISKSFYQWKSLIGRDLSKKILSKKKYTYEPIFFTSDDVFISECKKNILAVIAHLPHMKNSIWKFAIYYNNKHYFNDNECNKTEYELYNLENDPLEINNLAYDINYQNILNYLTLLLHNECKIKRLISDLLPKTFNINIELPPEEN